MSKKSASSPVPSLAHGICLSQLLRFYGERQLRTPYFTTRSLQIIGKTKEKVVFTAERLFGVCWYPSRQSAVLVMREPLDMELESALCIYSILRRGSTARHLLAKAVNRELGDVQALHRAYPRVPKTLHHQNRYRDPDAIRGGTWEALAGLLVRKNYYSSITRTPQLEIARRISVQMNPKRNRSRSFEIF